jgi:phage terminase small subunit
VTLTPLVYMLAVINDPTADPARRDRLAIAAAQYVHGRAVYSRQSKKAAAAAAAKQVGGEWGGDLVWDRQH